MVILVHSERKGNECTDFTFMLPCIVKIFFSITNQTTNYSNLFCYKTLHVSGIFSVHHQEVCTVHSVSFMKVFYDGFQAESGWNCSSILTLFGSGHQTCMKITSADSTVENS